MTEVFKCPACDGFCKRARKEGGKPKRCRACDGRGIVVVGPPPVTNPWTFTGDTVTNIPFSDTTITVGDPPNMYGADGTTGVYSVDAAGTVAS